MKQKDGMGWIRDESKAHLRSWEEFYRKRWQDGHCSRPLAAKDHFGSFGSLGILGSHVSFGRKRLRSIFFCAIGNHRSATSVMAGIPSMALWIAATQPPAITYSA